MNMHFFFQGFPHASVDPGYLHWLVEEGAHVGVVGGVHLLQEAAVLLLWSVAYQTLQHQRPVSTARSAARSPTGRATLKANEPGRTCLMSNSTVDVLLGGEVREKVTRSFFGSTTADWLTRWPFWSGTVIRTTCEHKQRRALVRLRTEGRSSCRGCRYLGANARRPQMARQAEGNNDQEQGE